MPVDYYVESDESDFSETDMSIRGRKGRASIHRRSVSRHRRPEARETLVVPAQQSSRVYRSASMGGRRPRQRESTPAVMIVNEQAQRTNNSNARDNKPRRVHQRATFEADTDEEIVKSSPSRRRATSGVSREASPYYRDYELLMGQRLLEKSDMRQDLEIFKQQQEIERLERELARHREKAEMSLDVPDPRMLREEELYEDELSERLRRLARLERKARSEEEQKKAEYQWRLKQFEEKQREAAGREELKARLREEKLKEIAKAQEEAEEIAKLKAQIIAEERQKAIEEEEKKKKEIEMKQAAVAEWKLEQERIKQREKEEQEEKDREFRERLRREFGYTEEEIEEKLKKKNYKEKGKGRALEETSSTTWIKVHRKHLLPETLGAYNLPWDWDEGDSNYIIIKRWITEDLQEELFAHTRRLRENKVLTQKSSSTTELKVNDARKDKMYMVRKKSPAGGRRMVLRFA